MQEACTSGYINTLRGNSSPSENAGSSNKHAHEFRDNWRKKRR